MKYHQIFYQWQERQLQRIRFQQGKKAADKLHNYIAAFELSKGCSVGCWFCSLCAESFQGYADYNQSDWKEILQSFQTLFGSDIGEKIYCFHATEPFDNPFYEKFLKDFYSIFTVWPNTTTALPLKDPLRIKKFIQLYQNKKHHKAFKPLRFSVLSPQIFAEINRIFSKKELRDVVISPRYKSPDFSLSIAGRARQVLKDKKEEATGGCFVGFLINLFDKSIELQTPCLVSDENESGQILIDKQMFSSPRSLFQKMQQIISSLPQDLGDLRTISFYPGIVPAVTKDTICFSSAFFKWSMKLSSANLLVSLIKEKRYSAEDLMKICYQKEGVSPRETYENIQIFYEKGLFLEK